MKSKIVRVLIFTFFVCATFSQDQVNDEKDNRYKELSNACGEAPKSFYTNCLGFEKFNNKEIFDNCEKSCKDKSSDEFECCADFCITKEMNFLKNGEIDKETTLQTVKQMIGDQMNEDWNKLATLYSDECTNPNSKFVEKPTTEAEKNCKEYYIGEMFRCLTIAFTYYCPTPKDNAEHLKIREYYDCWKSFEANKTSEATTSQSSQV